MSGEIISRRDFVERMTALGAVVLLADPSETGYARRTLPIHNEAEPGDVIFSAVTDATDRWITEVYWHTDAGPGGAWLPPAEAMPHWDPRTTVVYTQIGDDDFSIIRDDGQSAVTLVRFATIGRPSVGIVSADNERGVHAEGFSYAGE